MYFLLVFVILFFPLDYPFLPANKPCSMLKGEYPQEPKLSRSGLRAMSKINSPNTKATSMKKTDTFSEP